MGRLWDCTHSFSRTESAVVFNCLEVTGNLENAFFLTTTNVNRKTIHLSWMSFWEPRYIPSADSLDIAHHKFEALKVESSDGIEAHIEQDQGPLKEGVAGVGWNILADGIPQRRDRPTTGHLVHLVLDEIVNQWHQSSKEKAGHDLAVLDGTAVVGAQGQATQSPRQGGHQIRDHEDIVPVVVVGGGDIGPTSTGQSAEDTDTSNNLRQGVVRARTEDVPQENEKEARTGSDSNEDHEERALGVAIANGGGHGGEPFVGVAVVFILNNLMIMQRDADNQGAEKGGICKDRVSP